MTLAANKITPCLWFDTQAEEAANFYVSVFDNARLGNISRFGSEGKDIHGKEAGTVMVAEFEIEGQKFVALNGGPQFKFSEAVSFQVHCDTQEEIDYFWSKLSDGGEEGQCGWLKDKFGVSWQVLPAVLFKLLSGEADASQRVVKAFLQMTKFDIAALQRAYDGHG